jgi:hypothetical protein
MKCTLSLLLLCACLAGCGSTPLRSAQAKTEPTVSHYREATVIYVPEGTVEAAGATNASGVKCTVSESGGFAPILIPLAGVAADTLVNEVSSLLTKAKDNRTATWTASLGGVPLHPGKHYCLAISRGVINDLSSGPSSAALDPNLRFEGVPAFVLFADLSVTASTDPTKAVTFTIQPEFLSYADTAAPSRGKKRKDVSILLAFNGTAKVDVKPVKPPASEAGGSAAATSGAAKPPASTPKPKPPDDGDAAFDYFLVLAGAPSAFLNAAARSSLLELKPDAKAPKATFGSSLSVTIADTVKIPPESTATLAFVGMSKACEYTCPISRRPKSSRTPLAGTGGLGVFSVSSLSVNRSRSTVSVSRNETRRRTLF